MPDCTFYVRPCSFKPAASAAGSWQYCDHCGARQPDVLDTNTESEQTEVKQEPVIEDKRKKKAVSTPESAETPILQATATPEPAKTPVPQETLDSSYLLPDSATRR